jgi:hypothetical protein
VEALQRPGMFSGDVAALLVQEATSQVLRAQQEAENAARRDDEQDEEEDNNPEFDVAGEISIDNDPIAASSVQRFGDMLGEATNASVRLSRSVVNQRFGTLEMENDNEVKQGVADKVDGEVRQSFGNAKIGSGNKVYQGIHR